LSEDLAIRLYVPGRRTRRAEKIVLVSGLILLTVLGSIGTVLPGIVQALAPLSSPSTMTQNSGCPRTTSNSTTTTTGTVRWYYTWDTAGDLLKVTNSTGQASYAYDGGGRRVEAVESGAVWYFAYTGTEVLYKNRLNTYNCAYVFPSGLRIANFANGSTYYYHADALGSIRMITYPNGAVAYTNGYQPYGQYTGTLTGNLGKWAIDKFDGKPYSAVTGLYYEYQRWYDPSIGRFISADPFRGHRSNPQSLNSYIYVQDTPTSATDPTGLDGGFGADNRCEKLHQCGTINGAESIEVAKDALLFAGVVTLGVVVCILVCLEAAAALGLICSVDEPGCQGVGETLVKDVLEFGGKDAVVDAGSKDSIDIITKTGGDALLNGGGDALVKVTSDDLVDTSAFWRTMENGGYDLEHTEIHHLLPRQFQSFFESKGFTIDDYTVQLDRNVHRIIHRQGIGAAEGWNAQWADFTRGSGEETTSGDVVWFLGQLVGDFFPY